MTQVAGHPVEDLGGYVLGALSGQDREATESHLAACPGCQAELALLEGLPDLLGMLTPGEAAGADAAGSEQEAVPAGLAPAAVSLAAYRATRARRRRAARLSAAAATAALLVTGVFLRPARSAAPAAAGGGQSAGQSFGAAQGGWQTATAGGGLTAAVMYRPMEWGTQLQAEIAVAPGTRCQLQVVTAAGQRLTAGGWTTDTAAGTIWYPGSAPVPASGIRAFVITVGASQVTIPA